MLAAKNHKSNYSFSFITFYWIGNGITELINITSLLTDPHQCLYQLCMGYTLCGFVGRDFDNHGLSLVCFLKYKAG